MFPQGVAWQLIRQQALGVIPKGMTASSARSFKVSDWLSSGYYTPTNQTNSRKLHLSAIQTELAAALAFEAQYFLDCAVEHSLTVRQQLRQGEWHSAAWLCVTIYYWAFFCVSSFTRITGGTALWLQKTTAKNLTSLCGISSSLGAGAYRFTGLPSANSGFLEVTLEKPQGTTRVHDLVWSIFSDHLNTLVAATKGSNTLEERVYLALRNSFTKLGSNWPSELRNLANYSPGTSYTAGNSKSSLHVADYLYVERPLNFQQSLDRFENNLVRLPTKCQPRDCAGIATLLLIDLAFALDALSKALLDDVIDRRKLDRRWHNSRERFLRQQLGDDSSYSWPYAP